MLLDIGTKILFTGDSITDCSRERPIGYSPWGLGNGYVNLVSGMFTGLVPQAQINVLNTGISGNTIRDLEARWESDVMDLHPDWLCIMIGINDIWRQFEHPGHDDQGVSKEDFVKIYRQLIEKTQKHCKGIILMPPYFIDLHLDDPMTKMARDYAEEVKKLADEYQLTLCDVQKEFDAFLQDNHYMTITWDRVHPIGGHASGHHIIAKAFMKTIGNWPIL